jgi:hypothetical protein
MQIHFQETSIHQGRLGSIAGVVFIDFDGTYFPAEQWSDFPVVLANWWLATLVPLRDAGAPVILRFMDGPYSMSARRSGDLVLLQGVEHRRADIVRCETRLREIELQRELERFARRVADACAQRRLASPDLDELGGRLPH